MVAVILIGVVVAVALAVVVVVLIAHKKVEGRRTEELSGWAREHGWQYHEGAVRGHWRQRLNHLERFRILRAVSGEMGGLRITAADCIFTVTTRWKNADSGDTVKRDHRSMTVLVAHLPGAWPEIEVTPRGSRTARKLGERVTPEIGHPEFDGRFRIDTFHPESALPLLSPPVVQAHLSGGLNDWSLTQGDLLVTTPQRLEAGDLQRHVQYLGWVAGLLAQRHGG